MGKYHVGCGFAGIYAGRWRSEKNSPDGFHEWAAKSDVTNEAIHAVMLHLLPNDDDTVNSVRCLHQSGRYVKLSVEWENPDEA